MRPGANHLVAARPQRVIAKPFNGLPANQVFGEYGIRILCSYGAVPDIVGINDNHGPVAALAHAPAWLMRMTDRGPPP